MENKKFIYEYEDGKLILKADMDQDGIPSVSIAIDIKEIPGEIWGLIKKDKEPETVA